MVYIPFSSGSYSWLIQAMGGHALWYPSEEPIRRTDGEDEDVGGGFTVWYQSKESVEGRACLVISVKRIGGWYMCRDISHKWVGGGEGMLCDISQKNRWMPKSPCAAPWATWLRLPVLLLWWGFRSAEIHLHSQQSGCVTYVYWRSTAIEILLNSAAPVNVAIKIFRRYEVYFVRMWQTKILSPMKMIINCASIYMWTSWGSLIIQVKITQI